MVLVSKSARHSRRIAHLNRDRDRNRLRSSVDYVLERMESRTLLAATPIVSGQTIAGSLTHAGQQDTYTFTATAGKTFDVSVGDASAASGVHPYLQVFAPGGARVINNATSATSTSVDGVITVPSTGAGTYTIDVQDFLGNGTGAYDVELAVAPSTQATDSNGDGGVIKSGQTKAGTINRFGDIDVFTFSASAGNTFDISLGDATSGSSVRPYLQVFNPSGTRVINNATSATATSVDGIFTVPAGAGGTYTAIVQDFIGNSTGGAYDLELDVAPATQATDSNSDGGAISSGQTKAGTINRAGDLDVFTFTAAAGNSFDITLGDASATSTVHPYLQVFNPAGTRIINNATSATQTSVDGIFTVPAGSGGTFTAIVQDFLGNSSGGGYDLELDVAPATQATDSNGDGGTIANTQTKVGTINRFGDLDVFTFTASNNDSFDVTLGDATATSTVHPYLQVFGPTGTRIINTGTSATNTSVGQTYHIPSTGGSGTYTIIVQDFLGTSSGGTYDLSLTGNIHPLGPQISIVKPANQTAIALQSKSITLGSFSETNATGPYKVDVNWGDGSADSIFTVTNPGTIPATSHTFPKAGTDTVTEFITDAKSNKSAKVSFTVTVSAATATIGGEVFNDVNANGKIDTGELGLGLWTVYLDLDKSGTLTASDKKVTTDINGKWSFTGLGAGTYTVRIVQVAGSTTTKPTGAVMTITVVAGQTSSGNLFGEKS